MTLPVIPGDRGQCPHSLGPSPSSIRESFSYPLYLDDTEWFNDFNTRVAEMITQYNIKPNPIQENGTLDSILDGFELQKVSLCLRLGLSPVSFRC